MKITQNPSVKLRDGATLDSGTVLDTLEIDTTERFYVVAILEVADQDEMATVVVLRNLKYGGLFSEELSLFEQQREDGHYVVNGYPLPPRAALQATQVV